MTDDECDCEMNELVQEFDSEGDLVSGRCPECGKEYSAEEIGEYWVDMAEGMAENEMDQRRLEGRDG